MSTVRSEIIATISLLNSSEGGRSGPLPPGEYRGVLALDEENFSFRMFVESDSGLALGATAEFGIQLLFPEKAIR